VTKILVHKVFRSAHSVRAWKAEKSCLHTLAPRWGQASGLLRWPLYHQVGIRVRWSDRIQWHLPWSPRGKTWVEEVHWGEAPHVFIREWQVSKTRGHIALSRKLAHTSADRGMWSHCCCNCLIDFFYFLSRFMPPDDPLGRHGPTLDNFLRKRPLPVEQKRPLCPYGKKWAKCRSGSVTLFQLQLLDTSRMCLPNEMTYK